MLEIAVDDLRQMYKDSVVFHKNKPVYIEQIGGNGDVAFLDIIAQRREILPFSIKNFVTPTRRIGMVNIMGGVVYAYRLPVRKYKVGISGENIRVSTLDVDFPRMGRSNPRTMVAGLQCIEVGEALLNKYPTLNQALKMLGEMTYAVAFDKQFAVDKHRSIFYKTHRVGTIPEGKTKVDDIVFSKGNEHLILLLDGNYEKTVRIDRK